MAGPATAVYYGSVEATATAVVGAGLIGMNLLTSLADRLSRQKSSPPDLRLTALYVSEIC